ncbi:MAG TPA: glycosyltransferase family 39 protein, partial [Acidimicrobiales bacterium]|nr:glycosyltransferase family 39 protein [Acidimicrobiales bacterium]
MLPLVLPEVCAAAVLAAGVHRLDGPGTARALLVAGAILLARRGRAGGWVADRPEPRRVAAAALAPAAALVVAAAAVAHAGGGGRLAAGVALVAAAGWLLPAHRAFWSLGRRSALGVGLAGSAVAVAAGTAAAGHPPLRALAVGFALVAADLAMVLAARGARPSPGAAPAGGRAPAGAPGRALPAVAFAASAGIPLLVVARGIGSSDLGLLAVVAAVGLVPAAAAGSLPAYFVRGLSEGRRQAIVPALLAGAVLGAAAAMVATALVGVLVDGADDRLVRHATNFTMAMTFVGLAQVLVHHLVAVRRPVTALVHLGVAAAFQAVMMVTATGTDAALAVNAALGGAVILFTGLAVSTLVSAPFDLALPTEEATDGPTRVGWALGALTAVAVAVRLATTRPFWIDEAASVRALEGSLPTMVDAVRGSDPHPPLHLVLVWTARQAFGDGVLALRLPSLVAGALLVPLLYAAGKELYDRRVGMVAAVLGALAPALVWFSTEARPPVLAAFLAVLSLLAMVRALRRGWASDWALFGVAGAALLWSHQLAWVHVGLLHGAAALLVWRGQRGARLRCAGGLVAATAVVVAAGAALAAYRAGVGPPPALPPFEYATRAAPGEGTSLF